MKKVAIVAALMLLTCGTAQAGLRVIGSGARMRFDPSNFPPQRKAQYEIMQVRCVKCHTLERAIVAIQTGIAPISGQPFDRSATKRYGIKMLRKPDSNMTKYEVKEVVDLMNWLLEQAGQ